MGGGGGGGETPKIAKYGKFESLPYITGII